MSHQLTQVILAAGMSSRYGRLKQLDPVGPSGEAILDYTLFFARAAGFEGAVLVIRPELETAFDRHFDRYRSRPAIRYAYQVSRRAPGDPVRGDEAEVGHPAKPWGTAEAILRAGERVEGRFGVCNADDLYGLEAHRALGNVLRANAADSGGIPTAWMVGYRLDRTLSPHGGVSRAICAIDPLGRVERVRELTGIQAFDTGIRGLDESGCVVDLDGSERVSMNLWGFGPEVLPMLREGFDRFRTRVAGDEEFAISTAVDELVQQGRLTLRMVPTQSPWKGVTYASDRSEVARWIAQRVAEGDLPSSVFDS